MDGYPLIVEQAVAWRDMDSFGHVNNVVFFHYFELARIELLTRVGWFTQKESIGIGPIVASTGAKFRKPLAYPDRLRIGAKVSEISSDRVTVEHAIFSERWQAIAAEGPAVVVNFNYLEGVKAELTDEMRTRLMEYQG